MIALVTTVFAASVFGSLHCAGMCGAFVALCLGTEPLDARRHALVQSAYNGGRLVTYTALGAIAGTLGAALDLGGAVFGLQRFALLGAGGAMVVFGVITFLRLRGVRVPIVPLPRRWRELVMRGHTAAARRGPIGRALAIGLLSTFLPCGWLYAFAVVAAGTGSAVTGAVTMAVFWLGTLPIMVALGVGVQKASAPLRRFVPTATAIALVVVGLVTLSGRFAVPALAADGTVVAAGETGGDLADAAAAVEAIDQETLPCCAPAP